MHATTKISLLAAMVAGLSGCGEDAKDCGGFFDKTFGREACSVVAPTPTAGLAPPKVLAVSPMQATFGTTTTFTLTGENLTDTVQVALPDCDALTVTNRSNTQITFSCKPISISPEKLVVSNDGSELFAANVDFVVDKNNPKILTGVFVDSLVENIKYKGRSPNAPIGSTDKDGKFYYLEGDTVEFYVYKQPIASVLGQPTVHVYDLNQGVFLAGIDYGNRVAALLQSLDDDNNPENGIKINDKAASIFNNEQALDFYGTDESFYSGMKNLLSEAGITNAVTLAAAKAHVKSQPLPKTDDCTTVVPEQIGGLGNGKTVSTANMGCYQKQLIESYLVEWQPHQIDMQSKALERLQYYGNLTPEQIDKMVKENILRQLVENYLDHIVGLEDIAKGKALKGGGDAVKSILNIIKVFMKPDSNANQKASVFMIDATNYIIDGVLTTAACASATSPEEMAPCLSALSVAITQYAKLKDIPLVELDEAQKLALKKELIKVNAAIKIGAEVTKAKDLSVVPKIAAELLKANKELILLSIPEADKANDWRLSVYQDSIEQMIGILNASAECYEGGVPAAGCVKEVYSLGVENLSKLTIRITAINSIYLNQLKYDFSQIIDKAVKNLVVYDAIGNKSDAFNNDWNLSRIEQQSTLREQRLALIRKLRAAQGVSRLADHLGSSSLLSAIRAKFSLADDVLDELILNDVESALHYIGINRRVESTYVALSQGDLVDDVQKVNFAFVNMPFEIQNDIIRYSCWANGSDFDVENPFVRLMPVNTQQGEAFSLKAQRAGKYLAQCYFYGGKTNLNNTGIVVAKAKAIIDFQPDIARSLVVPQGAMFRNQPYTFTTSGQGKPALLGWDFGDGAGVVFSAPDSAIQHTFTTVGVFNVHLYSYTDDRIYEETVTLKIYEDNQPIIQASIVEPHVGDAVEFSLSTVWTEIKQVIWGFGNMVDGIVKAIGEAISYVFATEGVQTVSATAVDEFGQHIGRTELEVLVKAALPLPIASLQGSPTNAIVGQPTVFVLNNSKALEGKICSYVFAGGGEIGDSGGGDCSNANQVLVLPSITEVYNTAGTYTATLSVTDSQGKTASTTWLVNVVEATQTTTGLLNDTGITQCSNESSWFANCTAATMGGWFGLNQDAQVGRDSTAISKVGGGDAGFDFTKISATGEALPANATEWSCVRDNHTGLMWEVKTDDGGLRDKDNSYTWYNPDTANNGGFAGYENSGNNTQAFAQAVNAQGLCGFNNWRLPSKQELHSIVNYGKYNPAIDSAYFPNTVSSNYWSSSPVANHSKFAWIVDFYGGYDYNGHKSGNHCVRLVRSSQ